MQALSQLLNVLCTSVHVAGQKVSCLLTVCWSFHTNNSVPLEIYNIPPPSLPVCMWKGVVRACLRTLRSRLAKRSCLANCLESWDGEAEHRDAYLLLGAKYVLVCWAETFFFSWKIKWSDMIGISRAHAWICLLFCCCQWNKNHIRISNRCRNTFETSRLRSCSSKHRLSCLPLLLLIYNLIPLLLPIQHPSVQSPPTL